MMSGYMLKNKKEIKSNDRRKVYFRLEDRQRHGGTREFETFEEQLI